MVIIVKMPPFFSVYFYVNILINISSADLCIVTGRIVQLFFFVYFLCSFIYSLNLFFSCVLMLLLS